MFVSFILLLVTIFVLPSYSCLTFIYTPHMSSCVCWKKNKKKKQRGLCCGLCNYKFHICVADCGALTAAFIHHLNGYTTLLQYHSLPWTATYSSTKSRKPDLSFRNPFDRLITAMLHHFEHIHGPWERARTWVSKMWDCVFPQIYLFHFFLQLV